MENEEKSLNHNVKNIELIQNLFKFSIYFLIVIPGTISITAMTRLGDGSARLDALWYDLMLGGFSSIVGATVVALCFVGLTLGNHFRIKNLVECASTLGCLVIIISFMAFLISLFAAIGIADYNWKEPLNIKIDNSL